MPRPAVAGRPAPPVQDARAIARRYYEAFNAGDLDAYADLLDEDVEIALDGRRVHGRAAARRLVASLLHAFPGIVAVLDRTVAEGPDIVVAELHHDNAAAPAAGPGTTGASWRLAGTTCELFRLRRGRIAEIRSYYAAHPDDRTGVAQLPSRWDAHKLADEQAALRRVATLLARGASEEEVVAKVNEEIGRIVGADAAALFRFDPDDDLTMLTAWSAREGSFPIGDRRPLNAELREVRDSGRARRFDALPADAPFAEEARDFGIRSAVGVPVVVDGRVWGIAFAGSERREPLPADTERRIAGFTELVATALSNARARAELQQLADEQAALRRVAETVARGAPEADVLEAVVVEARRLVGAGYTTLARFEADGSSTLLAVHDAPAAVVAGRRQPPEGPPIMQEVRRSGRPVRSDSYEGRPAEGRERACRLGVSAGAAAPILVEGAVWGGLSALTLGGPVPPGLEHRLAQFADLAGTAIAGAHARGQLRSVADEQAALRRVAELVARGVPREELFASVAREAYRLVGNEATTLLRFDIDGGATVVAVCGGPAPVGTRIPISPTDESTPARIRRTGRPARSDDHGAIGAPAYARELRVGSSVGAPIVVEDRVWGMLGATTPDRPLPVAAELRLQQFAELIAAALANAQARSEVQHLADEQAALRRVAELVATSVAPEQVLDAVVAEASGLLGDAATSLSRYEPAGDATVVAVCRNQTPVGLRVTTEGRTCHGEVLRTGAAFRLSTFEGTPLAGAARELGVHSAVGVPVFVDGRIWGMLATTASGPQPPPPGTEARLAQFARLVGTAIGNAESRAQLTASRARVVAAADESRRRVQRDVHDGAQQRLVQSVITLKLAKRALKDHEGPAAGLVAESLEHAERASSDLRDLVRGILPASLSRGGLRAGVESLAADLPMAVEIRVSAPRLAASVETTAYFVIAEALTNVVKHAGASSARVTAAVEDDRLTIEVRDDGVGGADAVRGTGLTGLFDRVDASEGTLVVESPPGAGTVLRASLPATAPEERAT